MTPGNAGTRDSRRWMADGAVRALPFGLYIGFLALAPLLTPLVKDPRWLYALQIGLVALTLTLYSRRYTELSSPFVELSSPFAIGWKDGALAVVIGSAVFVAWIHLDMPWLSREGGSGFNPSNPDGSLNVALVILRIAGAAIVIPVMEELFWRSFIMRWIDQSDFMRLAPRAVSLPALLYGAIPFGLEHNLWFAGILAGLAYGWLYKHTGKLWVPVLAHALTNLLLGLWVISTGNWQFW